MADNSDPYRRLLPQPQIEPDTGGLPYGEGLDPGPTPWQPQHHIQPHAAAVSPWPQQQAAPLPAQPLPSQQQWGPTSSSRPLLSSNTTPSLMIYQPPSWAPPVLGLQHASAAPQLRGHRPMPASVQQAWESEAGGGASNPNHSSTMAPSVNHYAQPTSSQQPTPRTSVPPYERYSFSQMPPPHNPSFAGLTLYNPSMAMSQYPVHNNLPQQNSNVVPTQQQQQQRHPTMTQYQNSQLMPQQQQRQHATPSSTQQPMTTAQQLAWNRILLAQLARQQQNLPTQTQQPIPPPVQVPRPVQNIRLESQPNVTAANRWFWDTHGDYVLTGGARVGGTYAQLFELYPELRPRMLQLFRELDRTGRSEGTGAGQVDVDSGSELRRQLKGSITVLGVQAPGPGEQQVQAGVGGNGGGVDGVASGEAGEEAGEKSGEKAVEEEGEEVSKAPGKKVDCVQRAVAPNDTRDDTSDHSDYADITDKGPRNPVKKQAPSPNLLADLARTFIDGTRQNELTPTELQDRHASTVHLREALLVAVCEGIHPLLPSEPTAESEEMVGRWWRLYGVRAESVEFGRLWRQDLLRLLVECCQDILTLKRNIGAEEEA